MNKKRLAFLIGLSCVIATSYSQLQGKYTEFKNENVVMMVNEEFIFNKNNTFEYWYNSDLWNDNIYGKGKYILEKKKLILNFIDIEIPESYAEIEYFETPGDSIALNIEITASDGYLLFGTKISILNYANNEIYNAITDNQGKVTIKLLKTDKMKKMLIRYTGLKDFKQKIEDKSANYTITMENDIPNIIAGDNKKIYYYKMKNDMLYLKKDKNGKYKVFRKKTI